MELIIRGRQSGKTTELINISFTTKGVIVCGNHRTRLHIIEMAQKMHKEIPTPLTYSEVFEQGERTAILIDDCECFLEYITQRKVLAASFSATTKTKG